MAFYLLTCSAFWLDPAAAACNHVITDKFPDTDEVWGLEKLREHEHTFRVFLQLANGPVFDLADVLRRAADVNRDLRISHLHQDTAVSSIDKYPLLSEDILNYTTLL